MKMIKLNRPTKKKIDQDHVCKRFKTVKKVNGVREIVACRECWKERDLRTQEAM